MGALGGWGGWCRAFKMLTSNVMRVAAINSVGTFVLFLAKVAVVTATVFIGMAIMRGKVGRHVIFGDY